MWKPYDKVTDTVNSFCHHQTELELVFQSTKLGHIDDVMEALSNGFDQQMYIALTEEEHVNQYHLLELASKDLLHGITTLGQGRMPHELFPDMCLKEILCEVQTMVKK